jgi:transcriptional regulator with XRE-family HTH domain
MGDYKNQLRKFRKNRGLNQRELAAAIGTSQQRVRRYENGSPLKLATAIELAKSLDTTVAQLFPASRSVVQNLSEKGSPRSLDDPEIEQALLEAGIELDPREWTARIVVRGGDPQSPRLYHISVSTKQRSAYFFDWDCPGWRQAKLADESATFFVFDAGDRRVAVNLDHLLFWQNCFDIPSLESTSTKSSENGEELEEFSSKVDVYLAGARDPMTFGVDPEEQDAECSDPDAEVSDFDDEGDCRNLLFMLDNTPEKDRFIGFTDEDGEVTHFHVRDIAIIEVAKDVTDPEPLEEDEGDEAEKDDHPPERSRPQ